MELNVKDLGIALQPDVSPCLSLSSRFFCLDHTSEITQSMIDRLSATIKHAILGNSTPEPDFKYYGICFALSFHEYRILRHYIAPYRVELHISLENGYQASDAAPINERDFVFAKIKYQYGSKIESSSKLQFKLGWECKNVGTSAKLDSQLGEKLSNDYSVLLETEASLEYCTALHINPLTKTPGWIFERKPHQLIVKDTRYVWLIAEKPRDLNVPFKGRATMTAIFRKVKETEKVFESLTGVQQRILQDITFSKARTWLEKESLKRPVSISFEIN